MVPDKFNMVNMGGIDIIESQGVTVAGLYQRLVESIALCRYSTLYNWKFADINIPPTPVELVHENDTVTINEAISVDSNDVVHIHTLSPILELLSVSENGLYLPSEGYEGFSQVDVAIPLGAKQITENGIYIASDDNLDGYSSVVVNVSSGEVLPAEYTAISYIESTGTQYIDTGITINGKMEMDFEFSISEAPSGWLGLVGGGNGNAGSSFSFLINRLSMFSFQHGTGNYNDISFSFALDTLYHVTLKYGFRVGDNYYPYDSFTASSGRNCLLFNLPWNSSCFKAKIYSFDLKSDIETVRHMVPAIRDSDSAVGMYDFISETFFENAGTGVFAYG